MAGKHVLLEKPCANTAEETRKMFAFAQEKGLVLLEGFHYRYARRHISYRCVPSLCWAGSTLRYVA
jgi:predicted dehydrogenase